MRLRPPRGLWCTGEAEVGLVNVGGGVERLVAGPTAAMLPRNVVQLVVNQRQQLVERLAITRRELLEQVIDNSGLGEVAAAGLLWDHDIRPELRGPGYSIEARLRTGATHAWAAGAHFRGMGDDSGFVKHRDLRT